MGTFVWRLVMVTCERAKILFRGWALGGEAHVARSISMPPDWLGMRREIGEFDVALHLVPGGKRKSRAVKNWKVYR